MSTTTRLLIFLAGLLVTGCDEDGPRCIGGSVDDGGMCACPEDSTWQRDLGKCEGAVDAATPPGRMDDGGSSADDAGSPADDAGGVQEDGGGSLAMDAALADASAVAVPDAGGVQTDSGPVENAPDASTPGPQAGVILDLSGRQPPSTLPAGSWPSQMRMGHFRFKWTPSFPSSALPAPDFVVLFQFGGVGDSSDQIWLEKQGTICKAWVNTQSGVLLSIPSLVFSANQQLEYELDLPHGTWTVRGATSGNGTLSAGEAFAWPDGALFVGRSGQAGLAQFAGLISNVEGLP